MRWQETARGGTLYYPIWLAYATGLLEQRHDVKLVDASARGLSCPKIVEDVVSFNPDILVVDSSYTSWRNDLEVVDEIKRAVPESYAVVVGPSTSVYGQSYMQNDSVDAVIEGEFDFPLLDLASVLEEGGKLEKISSLTWKDDGRIRKNPNRELTSSVDMDKLPWVSKVYKNHLVVHDYFLSSALYPEIQIIAERGCPYLCTFCEWPQIFTKHKYRSRGVDNVIGEMRWIRDNLPDVKEIVFEDDTFTIDRRWVNEFCDRLIKDHLDFTWSAQIRADVEYELLVKLRRAGCRLVIVGFESGSNAVLSAMKKGITVEQSRSFGRAAKRAGILIHGDFIIGMPGETKKTIEETWDLIEDIKPEILQVSVATPFPGTEFYKYVKSNGYLLKDDPSDYLDEAGHQVAVVSYPWLAASEITAQVDTFLRRYYISVNFLPLAVKQVLRRNAPDEMRRLLKSATTFLKYVRRKRCQPDTTELREEAIPLVVQPSVNSNTPT